MIHLLVLTVASFTLAGAPYAGPSPAPRPGWEEPSHLPAALSKARELERAGDRTGALERYDRFLERKPGHVDGLLLRGRLLCDLARYEEAERDLKRCVELAPDEPAFRLTLGSLYLCWERFGEATREFEECLAMRPEDALLCNLIGSLQASRGRLGQAERYFRRATEANPGWPLPALERARLWSRRGRPARALGEIADLAERFPEEPRIKLAEAEVLIELNCLAPAVERLAAVLRHPASSATLRAAALEHLGFLYLRLCEWGEAVSCFESAILESDEPSGVFDDLALLYESMGRSEDAVALLELSIQLHDRPADRMDLADVLIGLGREEEALRALREVHRLGARPPRLLATLSRLEESCGEPARASAVFGELLSIAEHDGAWRHQPQTVIFTLERSLGSALPDVASAERAHELKSTLKRMLLGLDAEERRRLALQATRAGIPAEALPGPAQSAAPEE